MGCKLIIKFIFSCSLDYTNPGICIKCSDIPKSHANSISGGPQTILHESLHVHVLSGQLRIVHVVSSLLGIHIIIKDLRYLCSPWLDFFLIFYFLQSRVLGSNPQEQIEGCGPFSRKAATMLSQGLRRLSPIGMHGEIGALDTKISGGQCTKSFNCKN